MNHGQLSQEEEKETVDDGIDGPCIRRPIGMKQSSIERNQTTNISLPYASREQCTSCSSPSSYPSVKVPHDHAMSMRIGDIEKTTTRRREKREGELRIYFIEEKDVKSDDDEEEEETE